MALRTILEYPDPRLRTRAQPVTAFRRRAQQAHRRHVRDDVRRARDRPCRHPGGFPQRLLVIDVSEERNQPLVFINPEILSREGVEVTEEGCLSVPGIFDEVQRAAKIRVRAQDRNGEVFERDYEGILAVCVQHEMDHLEGKLFVDYLSDLKRERIRKKLEKERKTRATRGRQTGSGARQAY